MRGLLASPLGFLVGLSLGALGGGGSILAVPALVHGAGETAQVATTTSLFVVGAAALMGVGSHWRAGRVRLVPGLLFGAAGIGGSALGTALNQKADPDALLLAFSGVMVAAGIAMWRRKPGGDAPDQALACELAPVAVPAPVGAPAAPPWRLDATSTRAARAIVAPCETTSLTPTGLHAAVVVKVLVAGSLVGILTGFFGVGGGFIIVPALVLSLGFSMPEAVGTSLVVIAVNSAVALGLRAPDLDIRWGDAIPFLVMAALGTVVGRRIADRVAPGQLTRAFAVLLLVVAVYTGASAAIALGAAT